MGGCINRTELDHDVYDTARANWLQGAHGPGAEARAHGARQRKGLAGVARLNPGGRRGDIAEPLDDYIRYRPPAGGNFTGRV